MTHFDPQTLYPRLLIARQARGLSQEELAQKSGIPQSQISRLEKGKISDPSFFTVTELCHVLDLDLKVLSIEDGDEFMKIITDEKQDLSSVEKEIEDNDQVIISKEDLDHLKKDIIKSIENDQSKKARTRSWSHKGDDNDSQKLRLNNSKESYPVVKSEVELKKDKAFLCGNLVQGGNIQEDKFIALGEKELKNNVLITGNKRSRVKMLTQLAQDTIKQNLPLVLFDPRQELYHRFLAEASKEDKLDEVVFLNLNEDPISFNPLDIKNKSEIESAVNTAMAFFDSNIRISGAPRVTMFAAQALTALCYANLQITEKTKKLNIGNVSDFFRDPDFRRLIVEFCDNLSVRETFDPDYGPFEQLSEKQQIEYTSPFMRVLSNAFEKESINQILHCSENKIDFEKWIKEKKIVIVACQDYHHNYSGNSRVMQMLSEYLKTKCSGINKRTLLFYNGFNNDDYARSLIDFIHTDTDYLSFILSEESVSFLESTTLNTLLKIAATKITFSTEMRSAISLSDSMSYLSPLTIYNHDIVNLEDDHFYFSSSGSSGHVLAGSVDNIKFEQNLASLLTSMKTIEKETKNKTINLEKIENVKDLFSSKLRQKVESEFKYENF